LVVHVTADKLILSFVSEDEGGDWEEGEVQLSSMISVRAELAHGDLRALYLAWLLCAQSGDLDDDEVEPPVPPGSVGSAPHWRVLLTSCASTATLFR